ncbi:hypothetical protein BD289DRAFT_445821 [Coniella lustricola]|uniref:Uncharacterized protein n=1 Tax=Coniella lustricola TaxID=2025994 RepID=A0A2T2ZUN2_9PEZI|nr:hypothetical protein BD289DRAFT_445821 [Coniella lustricola]
MGQYLHRAELQDAALPPRGTPRPSRAAATTRAAETRDDTGSSTLLSDRVAEGLPTALKSSFGPLRTIRRSVSIRGWAAYLQEVSTTITDHDDQDKSSNTRPSSPYPSSCPSSASSVAAENEAVSCHEDKSHNFAGTGPVAASAEADLQPQHQPVKSGSTRWKPHWASLARTAMCEPGSVARRVAATHDVVEYAEPQRAGEIDRFSGVQGQLLVNHALAESIARPLDHDGRVRSAYIQGVAWLLAALPQDLGEHEHAELQRALPPSVRQRLVADERQAQVRRRSLIHQAVAVACVQLYALAQTMLAILGQVAQWDRQHRVTEGALQWAARMAALVGRGLLAVLGLVYAHGGAKLSADVARAAGYVVGEVAKGVHDATLDWRRVELEGAGRARRHA